MHSHRPDPVLKDFEPDAVDSGCPPEKDLPLLKNVKAVRMSFVAAEPVLESTHLG